MTTSTTPTTDGDKPNGRDNTVRTRQMTDQEKSGEVPVAVGKATEPMVGVEHATPAFKPTREMANEVKAHTKHRDTIAAYEAIIANPDSAKPAAVKKANDEIGPERKRLAATAERLRAFGYTLETDASDPVPPAKAMSKADRYKQAAASAAAKRPPKKSGEKKPPRFSDEIRTAVHRARYELSAKNPKLKAGDHVPGASAGNHIRVREFITNKLAEEKKDVTPANVLKLTGYASYAALESAAKWEGTRADLEPLQELGANFRGTSWEMGRFLAAIVTVFIWDLKAKAQAEKDAAKAAAKAEKDAAKQDSPRDDAPADEAPATA